MRFVFILLLSSFIVAGANQPLYAQAGSLSEARITELVDGDLRVASKILKSEIENAPNDAALYKLAGDVYAVRAQGASIFSAPGLAKKCVKSYKKAVELAPDNTRYRMSLMQYYLFAPGIVGGSKKLGLEEADAIKKLDEVSGVVAQSFVLLKKKDQAGLEDLFANLRPELHAHPRVKMAKANYLRSTEQFDFAATLLAEVIETPSEQLGSDFERLLPYQALLQAGFLGTKSETHQTQGIKAFERYLASAPDTYRLTSKKWVRLFLGKIYTQAGQTDLAKSTLLQAKKEALDENLIDEIDDALKELI